MALERWPCRRTSVRAQVLRLHEKGTSTNNSICAACWTLRVLSRGYRIVVAAIPVLAPLHHVARHVERTVWGGIALRLNFPTLAAVIVADELAGVELLGARIVRIGTVDGVAPGKPPLVR